MGKECDRYEVRARRKKRVQLYNDPENAVGVKRIKINTNQNEKDTHQRRVLNDIHNIVHQCSEENMVTSKYEESRDVEKMEAIEFKQESEEKEELDCTELETSEEDQQDSADRIANDKITNQEVFDVSNYVIDIYKYLLKIERKYLIPKNHLVGQIITGKMRSRMIDWLAEVVNLFNVSQETFQLSTYLIDKYMSITGRISKNTRQLVCVGALFVAAKYEETKPIQLSDLIFICNQAWSESDIISMECTLLHTIEYALGRPLAIHFIRRFSKISGASAVEHCYAKYFSDLSMLSYQLCEVKPSIIAAASIFLAFCVSRNRVDTAFWVPQLTATSSYGLSDFYHILPLIATAVTKLGMDNGRAIRLKYSNSRLYSVSLMPGCAPDTGIINHFCLA